jgi:hypothetical protein
VNRRNELRRIAEKYLSAFNSATDDTPGADDYVIANRRPRKHDRA